MPPNKELLLITQQKAAVLLRKACLRKAGLGQAYDVMVLAAAHGCITSSSEFHACGEGACYMGDLVAGSHLQAFVPLQA